MAIELINVEEYKGQTWLNRYLVSGHKDKVYMSQELYFALDRLDTFYFTINEYLKQFGIVTSISSALRTQKINKEVGGVPTSQHLFAEALDLKFFNKQTGKQYKGRDLRKVYDLLQQNETSLKIIQMFTYYDRNIIHLGFLTLRAVKKGVKYARRR